MVQKEERAHAETKAEASHVQKEELFDVQVVVVTTVMKETASPSKCLKPNNFLAWEHASTCFKLGQGHNSIVSKSWKELHGGRWRLYGCGN